MTEIAIGPAMPQTAQRRLPVEGVFVVQLRADSDVRRRQLSGRVEHVVSGESEPFASLEALLDFMMRFTDNRTAAPG